MDNLFKKLVTILFVGSFLSSAGAKAADKFGLGVVLGQPTGLSARLDKSATTAFDAALAWRMGDHSYVLMHADYLWLKPNLLNATSFRADFYYGVGAILAVPESEFAAALRIPAGLSHKFRDPDLELFGELAIAFTVVPETDFEIVGGVGLRYWF